VVPEGFCAFVMFEAVRDGDDRIVDFRYAEANSHAVAMVGRRSRDELIGKNLTEVVPGPDGRGTVERYARVMRTNAATEEEVQVDVPGASRPWIGMNIVPLERGVAVMWLDISQRRTDEDDRKDLLAFLDSIIENVPATIFVKNAKSLRFERLNIQGERLFGTPQESAVGKSNLEAFPKDQAEAFERSDREVLATGKPFSVEQKLRTSDGERWFQTRKIPLYDSLGVPKHLLGISIDITEIKRAEESLKGFEILFRHSPLGILIGSSDGVVVDANAAATDLLGFAREELIGQSSSTLQLLQGNEQARIFDSLRTRGFVRALVLKITVKSGAKRDVMISVDRLELERETRYIATLLDVTALKRAEESLRQASLVDDLTGLHNRRGFFALGEQQVKLARRQSQPNLALLFADLDGLKEVNDVLGHHAGDELIRQAAKVLRQTFRESDIIARLGGDEFVVLAAFDPSRTGEMVARLRAKLDTLNMDRPNEPALAMSVGVSSFQPGNTLEEVLADADRKMYADKAQRRARAQEGKPASDRPGSR
jgi:diguanylate cyclase (GGDEF)-like protein/PAS domain S-box-containing protein